MAEMLDRDLRPLGDADLIEHQEGRTVVGARGFQLVDEILGVAEIGEVGHRRQHHAIGPEHDLFRPGGPEMRQVDGNPRHILAHDAEHGLAGFRLGIVRTVERAGSGEQAQMV